MPDTLHHYTTAQGLLGILEPVNESNDLGLPVEVTPHRSISLWATDARYLNDSAELTYAAAALADAIVEQLKDVGDERRGALRRLADQIREGDFTLDDIYVQTLVHTAYVACFCTNGDLLSQWRGYGANGGGYSVEFYSSALRELLVPSLRAGDSVIGHAVGGASLVKVTYGLDDQHLQAAARSVIEGESGWELFDCLKSLAQFKNAAFEEEDEWRLVATNGTFYAPLRFRPGANGGIIPYLRLIRPQLVGDGSWIPSAIKSVTVGPGPDQPLRVEAVEQLLRQRGFLDVAVIPSKATYRG
ncbi:DUF2971 domain-containing protein [Nocardia otitidiscaviarum]|uniref:DUF2971 domain-containing protein n=1 Tax=Nocardia otitidiscaviarum TaxID=1823 RepID=UPI001892DF4A|nr:DUF2971 domain-containing protein [Nocardia otitidiscaviarum]MBF6240502.1 DUF2971 domain-containing protein [Nocardia otitidiscaviarum]